MASGIGVWEELYRTVRMPHLDPAFTGFNTCIDRIIPVTAGVLRSLENSAVPGAELLLSRLVQSMRTCTADEWFVTDQDMYQALTAMFQAAGRSVVGGQAGIAAIHLHSIGVPSVTCVIPGAGSQVCALLQQKGVSPLTFGSKTVIRTEAVHLVFEYAPGLIPAASGVTPRNNRFIASPLHDPSTTLVPANAMEEFLAAIAPCRRAFLSGYQYLQKEQDFFTAATQLCQIRDVHADMRTHVECVTVSDRSVLSMILRHILPHADSIGLNERELWLLLRVLKGAGPAAPSVISLPANVRGAIALAEATGVSRIHLHTYGYYLLVLGSESAEPKRSRDALLLAARAAAGAAGKGERQFSQEAISACDSLHHELSGGDEPGIFTSGDRAVVVIPTCIVQGTEKTTGLGDIISATAFVADRF